MEGRKSVRGGAPGVRKIVGDGTPIWRVMGDVVVVEVVDIVRRRAKSNMMSNMIL